MRTRVNLRTLTATLIFLLAPLALGTRCPAPQDPSASGEERPRDDLADLAVPVLVPLDGVDPADGRAPLRRQDLRRQFAEVDLDRLRDPSSPDGQPVVALDLFPDVRLVAEKSRLATREDGYSWFGHVDGDASSQVVLTVVEEQLAGIVMHGGRLYRIRGTHSGAYAISEVDAARFPSEHGELSPRRPPVARDENDPKFYEIFELLLPRTANIGVIYTWPAKFAVPNIQAEIQLAVDLTNQALINSGAMLQLNLAATGVTSYQESGDFDVDLDRLQDTSDGHLDFIHATRDLWNWKADIVALVVEDGGGNCGLGYVLKDMETLSNPDAWAFHVVDVDCMVDNLSLPHEAGHNMGADHDWFVQPDPGHNHGYILHGKKRRTIMAYWEECDGLGYDCPRVLHYSNPYRSWDGAATGIPAGQAWEADNVLEINQNRHALADFR